MALFTKTLRRSDMTPEQEARAEAPIERAKVRAAERETSFQDVVADALRAHLGVVKRSR